jgi:opacity protein-like surface antigen
MKKQIKATAMAATAMTILGVGTAQAQTSQDWSGPYIGASFGYAKTDKTTNETVGFDKDLDGRFNDTITTAAGANAFSPGFCDGMANGPTAAAGCVGDDDDNWEIGLRGGYDLQFGNVVLGAVAEIERLKLEDRVTAFSTTPAFYTFDRKLESMAALRLRAGYAMGPYLGYVTGGVARGEVKHTFRTSNGVNTFVQSGTSDKADGYQGGLGLERQLDGRVRLGVEYLYSKLDDGDYTVRAQGPAPATNPFILTNANGADMRRTSDDFEIHSVRLTASYRF